MNTSAQTFEQNCKLYVLHFLDEQEGKWRI